MNPLRTKFDSVDSCSSDPCSPDPCSSEHLGTNHSTVGTSTSHCQIDGAQQKTDIPNHIQEYRRIFETNRKLHQTRKQPALTLSHFGDSKGLVFSDGAKAALITLEKTELFYLKDANGQKTYYGIGSDSRVDQPLRPGSNTLTNKSCTASPTFFVGDSMNLSVDGLAIENESSAKATFDVQSGMLAFQLDTYADSNQNNANELRFLVWGDSTLPGEAALDSHNQSAHSEQNDANSIDHVENNNEARSNWPSRFIRYMRRRSKKV